MLESNFRFKEMTTCSHELPLNYLFYVYAVINEVVLLKMVEQDEML